MSQDEQVLPGRDGKAVPGNLDEEQEHLGQSRRFWDLITERRRQPTLSRAGLERCLAATRAGARP